MKIVEIIKKKLVFSLEFFPPKTAIGLENLVSTVRKLSVFKPDFISVTDSGYGLAKGKNVALSQIIKEKTGIEIMPHLTCINNTPEEIDRILKEITERGIENVLALRGDKANYAVFDNHFNYAIDLIKQVRKKKNLCIGVAGYPEKHPESSNMEEDILHLKEKINAGGEFIITQLFFDNAIFFRYLELLSKNGIKVPVIPGVMPIHNKTNIAKIISKAGNISLPKQLGNILYNKNMKAEDFTNYAAEFTIKQCNELIKNGVNAIHFFTFNKSEIIEKVLKEIH